MNYDNAISSCHLPELGMLGKRYGSGYRMWMGRRVRV
jgi:hypothetical protein